MKKLIAVILSLSLTAGITSCSGEKPENSSASSRALPKLSYVSELSSYPESKSFSESSSETDSEPTFARITKEKVASWGDKKVILAKKDFFYTNKTKNFTVWLGMSKKECLDIVGPMNPNDSNETIDTDFISPIEIYQYKDQGLLFLEQKLIGISPHEAVFSNWESYKGINSKTTVKSIVKIFGQPTGSRYYDHGSIEVIAFAFEKVEGNKYRRIKDAKEWERLAMNEKKYNEIKVFSCWYDDYGDITTFGVNHLMGMIDSVQDIPYMFSSDNEVSEP